MNKQNKFFKKGFTLIELLVVVAIVGILTTVVLIVTDTSREKARRALIMSDMREFEKLLTLESLENGNYAKLQTTNFAMVTSTSRCNTVFPPPPAGSNYYLDARRICAEIITSLQITVGGSAGFMADTVTNLGVPQDNKYSVMTIFNDNTYFCLGSSGSYFGPEGNLNLKNPGCWQNP